jgi:hypothetical protein
VIRRVVYSYCSLTATIAYSSRVGTMIEVVCGRRVRFPLQTTGSSARSGRSSGGVVPACSGLRDVDRPVRFSDRWLCGAVWPVERPDPWSVRVCPGGGVLVAVRVVWPRVGGCLPAGRARSVEVGSRSGRAGRLCGSVRPVEGPGRPAGALGRVGRSRPAAGRLAASGRPGRAGRLRTCERPATGGVAGRSRGAIAGSAVDRHPARYGGSGSGADLVCARGRYSRAMRTSRGRIMRIP